MSEHDQNDREDGLEIVTFENDEGEVLELAQLITFELDGETYAALAPPDQLDEDDVELWIFHTGVDENGPFYRQVEDDDLADRTFAMAVELLGGDEGEE